MRDAAILETARRIGASVLGPNAQATDRASGPNHANFRALAESGLLGLSLPREYGGLGLSNVEFVQAGIEKLPLPDGSVDVLISNGVFNLCPDKPGELAETFRVLRPGGRLQMADILLHDDVTPEEVAHKGEWSD